MPGVGFTIHRQTRNAETPQAYWELRDAAGRLKAEGACNQGKHLEVGDGETLSIKVLALPETEAAPQVKEPQR